MSPLWNMGLVWSEVYDRILADMRTIWGEMAVFMIKKRANDVKADLARLRKEDLERIIELLREKTLPSTLGPDGADAKARQYLAWLGDGSPVT
jgi:hypothetical protein